MVNLDRRVALVTGGSRGIGRAVCLKLAQAGARVAVGYVRDETAAQNVVGAIRRAGGEALAFQGDLAEPAEGRRLLESVVARLGPLDILVVSHGIWRRAPVETMTDAQWNETIDLNLSGAAAVCRAASAHMAARGAGAIVTIASTAGQRGEAFYSHYAASKGALLALTKSLAAELGPRGIRVNCVAPGWVTTDMTREVLAGPEGPRHLSMIPTARAATPDEIAGPVLFLASDLASFVYGEVLCVNGGAVMGS
jgi:3-oxoacyl-[acyl-carrier protein] reductase